FVTGYEFINHLTLVFAEVRPGIVEMNGAFIQERIFNFADSFFISFSATCKKIEPGRACDLQIKREQPSHIYDSVSMRPERQSGFFRWLNDQIERFASRKCSQIDRSEDIEERRIRYLMRVTEFLQITAGRGNVGDVVIVCNRSKERVEIQRKLVIRRDCVKFVQQNDQFSIAIVQTLQQSFNRIKFGID